MTTPQIKTFSRNFARWYEHPLADEPAPAGRPVEAWSPLAIGVTSVLNSLNKPALVNWASKMAAEFAVDNVDAWTQLPSRTAKVELISGASKRSAGDAADTGTAAHSIAEAIGANMFLGGPEVDVPDDMVPWAMTYLRFLKEMRAEPVMLERTVWSHWYGYAGTFDGIYRLGGEPELVMIDTKTGKSGIYPETALQQVAYCRADVLVNPDGTEEAMPKVEKAYALWLRPQGYALHPLKVGEPTWESFKHLVEITRWKNDVGANAVGKPINPVPLRK